MTELARNVAILGKRQGWKCCWCRFEMARNANHAVILVRSEAPAATDLASVRRARRLIRATFDHQVPRAHGGPATRQNGKAACAWCNSIRGTEEPLSFGIFVNDLLNRGRHPRQVFRAIGTWSPSAQRRAALVGATR